MSMLFAILTTSFGLLVTALLCTILMNQLRSPRHIESLNSNRAVFEDLLREQRKEQQSHRETFDAHQLNTLKLLQDTLHQSMDDVRKQVNTALLTQFEALSKRVQMLTNETQTRLKEISGQVDKRLSEGFEKTQSTFVDVVKRLAIIDQAQKRITELSSTVVDLQEVLSDKKSRGAFGEVQLSNLIANMIPETHYTMQHTFSTGKRVDCLLRLPEPTGHIAIDAKFPLESYRILTQPDLSAPDRKAATAQFKQDIKKHIADIKDKYILPSETSDGAVMFIPSESIFSEIHGNHADLIDHAHHARVWLVSPTTMMAILTTARAVLKDAATRKQVNIIQEHLVALSKDFSRFETRMDKLATHINQAQQDVEQVHMSSKKITSRFSKIERVDLSSSDESLLIE